MDLSYKQPYWSGYSNELRFSTYMQLIVTVQSKQQSNDQRPIIFSPPLFRPYNLHFIHSVPRGHNKLHTSQKSAFKPVGRLKPKTTAGPDSNFIICPTERCFCRPPKNSHNNFETLPHGSQMAEESSDLAPLNLKKYPSNIETTSSQYREASENSKENIHHLNSPLELIPKSAIQPTVTMPPKNCHTLQHDRKNGKSGNEVPVIDLTLNDDVEQPIIERNSSRSIIELNVTPPLDINGNEILITTNTKTMQAIAYNKPTDLRKSSQNQSDKMSAGLSQPSNELPPKSRTEQMNCPILYSNLTADTPSPPKKESKYDVNYNRWMQYLRSYNGFRLFAQQNYMKTRMHRLSKGNKPLIQSTLLKWWNSLDLAEKEQYAQIAQLKWCQAISKQDKEYRKQRSISDTMDETNVSSSVPTLHDYRKNSSNAMN